MKKKLKPTAVVLILITLTAITVHLTIGNPFVLINNNKLANSVKSIKDDINVVHINEIVPFEWDAVYTFDPYTSKKEIEQIVGFRSRYIKANNINEGMVHLLFVKGEKVTASVLGYSTNLGYCINLPSKIAFSENAKFDVLISDGIVALTYANSADCHE